MSLGYRCRRKIVVNNNKRKKKTERGSAPCSRCPFVVMSGALTLVRLCRGWVVLDHDRLRSGVVVAFPGRQRFVFVCFHFVFAPSSPFRHRDLPGSKSVDGHPRARTFWFAENESGGKVEEGTEGLGKLVPFRAFFFFFLRVRTCPNLFGQVH